MVGTAGADPVARLNNAGATGKNGQKRAAAVAAAARVHSTNRYSPFRVCDDDCDCRCRRSCVCVRAYIRELVFCVRGFDASRATARVECAVCAYVQYMRECARTARLRCDATRDF